MLLPDKLQQTQTLAAEHRQHLAQRRGNGGGGQFVQTIRITHFQQTDGAADTDIFFRRAADTVDKILLELLGFVFRKTFMQQGSRPSEKSVSSRSRISFHFEGRSFKEGRVIIGIDLFTIKGA